MSVFQRFVMVSLAWYLLVPAAARAQQPNTPPAGQSDAVAIGADTREGILQSGRWKKLRHSFEEWLSVQEIYSEEEIKELKAGLEQRIASMSVSELEDFIHDTEERLTILLSDEATDARAYLNLFTMKGRREQLGQGESVQNVFDMTTTQLRSELRQFQDQRASRTVAHAAFNRAHQQEAAAVRQNLNAREKARQQAQRQSANAAGYRMRSTGGPYAPRPRPGPAYNKPKFHVNAWGGVSRPLP